MRKRLWGIIPLWAAILAMVFLMAGTALAAYQLTSRDIPVQIEEPITVTPATVTQPILYPGQSVEFTVTNSAPIGYGLQYACDFENPDSGIEVKMQVDADGPGTEYDYTSHSESKTVNIAPNGIQYLRIICTEESAPVSGTLTVTFNRKAATI